MGKRSGDKYDNLSAGRFRSVPNAERVRGKVAIRVNRLRESLTGSYREAPDKLDQNAVTMLSRHGESFQ